MFKRIFILALVCVMLFQTHAQRPHNRPRLMVGIMIDGLQQRHIEQLWTRFESNGFKRLTGQGANFNNLFCNMVSSGSTSDIATLMTGTVPYYHGVTGSSVFNRRNANVESVFFDRTQTGIETDFTLSARNLLASTIIDELMMAAPNQSKSYAIGINAEDAIALGGHAANGVVWINDVAMKWSTSSYYPSHLPWQAMEMNRTNAFQIHASQVWTPLFQPSTYIGSFGRSNVQSFSFNPASPKNQRSLQSILKNTPSANALVADLALRIVREERMGRSLVPDALMLQFTVRTPNEQKFSLQSIAKEDMYLRLDRELQNLIQRIENEVGERNVLYFLFGNQMATYSPDELRNFRVHAGYFNANRAMALLNSYLMALYGQERWVIGYYNKNIYLNKQKIEEKNLDFANFQKVVADFMLEFEGVQSSHSYIQLMFAAPHPASDLARVRNSVHRRKAGDVILTLQPGWLEVDDNAVSLGESNDMISRIPFFISGWEIAKQTITKGYNITDIASTLAGLMQIPLPNANVGSPVELMLRD